MSEKQELAIEVNQLSKSLSGRKVLEDINFQVKRGTVMGFLGPNGAGKTTTIKIMLDLVKPDSGSVKILGNGIKDDLLNIKKNIGYVPEVVKLYEYMRIEEILKFNRSFYSAWNETLEKKYLSQFNIDRKKKCGELSQGERKQLGLILALVSDPELVILDEPVVGLDPLRRQELIKIILEELVVRGKTVFLASHLLSVVEQIADEVVIINKGQICDVRPVSELKENVKKIRVVFQHQPEPGLLEIPEITEYEQKGKEYLISVSKNLDQVVKRLQEEPLFAFEIIDQDLEQIFLQQVKGEDK